MIKKDEALKLAVEAAVEQYAKTGNGKVLDATIRQIIANEALNKMAENAKELGLDYEPAQQQEPVAWIRWEWNRTGRKSLVFEKPVELPLSEEATGVVYDPLYTSPQPSKPWVGLVHEETHEAIGTAGADLLELAKLWSDNKVHVYQFDNEARKIIEAVLRRASAKLREKNA